MKCIVKSIPEFKALENVFGEALAEKYVQDYSVLVRKIGPNDEYYYPTPQEVKDWVEENVAPAIADQYKINSVEFFVIKGGTTAYPHVDGPYGVFNFMIETGGENEVAVYKQNFEADFSPRLDGKVMCPMRSGRVKNENLNSARKLLDTRKSQIRKNSIYKY